MKRTIPGEALVLFLNEEQAIALLSVAINGVSQCGLAIEMVVNSADNPCDATARLNSLRNMTVKAGEVVRQFQAAGALKFYLVAEGLLLEKLDERLKSLEHTHDDEVEDLTRVM